MSGPKLLGSRDPSRPGGYTPSLERLRGLGRNGAGERIPVVPQTGAFGHPHGIYLPSLRIPDPIRLPGRVWNGGGPLWTLGRLSSAFDRLSPTENGAVAVAAWAEHLDALRPLTAVMAGDWLNAGAAVYHTASTTLSQPSPDNKGGVKNGGKKGKKKGRKKVRKERHGPRLQELERRLADTIAAKANFDQFIARIVRQVQTRRPEDLPLEVLVKQRTLDSLFSDILNYAGMTDRDVRQFRQRTARSNGLQTTNEKGELSSWVREISAAYDTSILRAYGLLDQARQRVEAERRQAEEARRARQDELNRVLAGLKEPIQVAMHTIVQDIGRLMEFQMQLRSGADGISPLFEETINALIAKMKEKKKVLQRELGKVARGKGDVSATVDGLRRRLDSPLAGDTSEEALLLHFVAVRGESLPGLIEVLNDLQVKIGVLQRKQTEIDTRLPGARENAQKLKSQFEGESSNYDAMIAMFDEIGLFNDRELALLDTAKARMDAAEAAWNMASGELDAIWIEYLSVNDKIERLKREYEVFLDDPELLPPLSKEPPRGFRPIEGMDVNLEQDAIVAQKVETLDWDQWIELAHELLETIAEADAHMSVDDGGIPIDVGSVMVGRVQTTRDYFGRQNRLSKVRLSRNDERRVWFATHTEALRELVQIRRLLSPSNPHRTGDDIIEALRWERDQALGRAEQAGSPKGRP